MALIWIKTCAPLRKLRVRASTKSLAHKAHKARMAVAVGAIVAA